jgi:tRNA (adenine37-N6)-methyltransferase
MDSPPQSLSLTPIGVVRTPYKELAEAPRQATASNDAEATIELYPGQGYEDALSDLEGWDRIWVLFWFDHSHGWKPKVLPPRSDQKRGVFATRAPHRPNPVGMSAVGLVGVEGLRVKVRGADMLDGTPVLDLKPYVAYADSFPDARAGWLANDCRDPHSRSLDRRDPRSRSLDPGARWEVVWGEPAKTQGAWLEARGVELVKHVGEILAVSPRPHAYRRIRSEGAGFRLAWKEFRVLFRIDGRVVTVERLASGYRPAELAAPTPGLELHRAFVEAFG